MSSNATGNAEIQVSTTLAGSIFGPSITVLPAGGWIAVWTAESEDAGDEFQQTFMQRFDADGNPVGAETQVGDSGIEYHSPTVVPLSDGGWLVFHERNGSDTIVQQRFDANGDPVGVETQVNTINSGLRDPSVALLEDGGWVVI